MLLDVPARDGSCESVMVIAEPVMNPAMAGPNMCNMDILGDYCFYVRTLHERDKDLFLPGMKSTRIPSRMHPIPIAQMPTNRASVTPICAGEMEGSVFTTVVTA